MSLQGSEEALAAGCDLVLLDLDGVVYIGPDAVPGAVEALAAVRERPSAPGLAFVTNNAFRPPGAVGAHLRELGIPCQDSDVVTSAQAAAAMLAEQVPAGTAVLVVGGPGVREALTEAGLRPVDSMDDRPGAVVQGFTPDVGWRLLAEGTRAVRSGVPWIATNTDLTIPTPYGPGPGNGTLVQAIATASGVSPQVAGKPQPPLFVQAAARFGSTRPLVVGDRLDTDIEGGVNAGMPTLLVLTGVTGARELLAAPPERRPDYLSEDLGGLLTPHPSPVKHGDKWICGDARITVHDNALAVLTPGAQALDLLRAACAAIWSDDWRDEPSHQAEWRGDPSRQAVPDPQAVLVALGEIGKHPVWSRYRDV